jgi:hypothetical protein
MPMIINASIKIFEQAQRSLSLIPNYTEAIRKIQNSLAPHIADIDYEITNDGSIISSNNSIPIDKIQEMLKDSFGDLNIQIDQSPNNDNLYIMIKRIDSLKEPFIKRFAFHILMHIFLTIFINPIFLDSDNSQHINKNILIREIKKSIKDGLINNVDYLGSEVVTVNVLNVRERSFKRSRLIGKPYLGQNVKVIYRKRKWVLIEYRDDFNGIKIQGWVFSRYSIK